MLNKLTQTKQGEKMSKEMKSGESVIYRGHKIFCNYEKVKPNKFEFGYDVIDQDEGILGRYSTYDQAEKAITKNRNIQLENKRKWVA